MKDKILNLVAIVDDQQLISKAKFGNIESLFQLGIIYFLHNRIGFAKASWQHAVNLGNRMAQKYLSILNDQSLSINDRIKKLTQFIN